MDPRLIPPTLVVALIALFACSAKPLTANDMPRPKAGLWLRSGIVNGAPTSGQPCFTGRPVSIPGSGNCAKITYARTSSGFEIQAQCGDAIDGAHVTLSYAGDFQSSFTVDGRNEVRAEGQPPLVDVSHNTYRYVGRCRPGQAPDDQN